jgi:hypothetical protein
MDRSHLAPAFELEVGSWCGAGPTQPCRGLDGTRRWRKHRERVEVYRHVAREALPTGNGCAT